MKNNVLTKLDKIEKSIKELEEKKRDIIENLRNSIIENIKFQDVKIQCSMELGKLNVYVTIDCYIPFKDFEELNNYMKSIDLKLYGIRAIFNNIEIKYR